MASSTRSATRPSGRALARLNQRFDRSLLLVQWLANELGGRYNELLERVKDAPDAGAPGASARLMAVLSRQGVRVTPDALAQAPSAPSWPTGH